MKSFLLAISFEIDLIDGKLIVKSNFKKQKIEGSTGDRSVEKGIVNEERKKFHCDWLGCGKSYSKPIRLVEHKRSHTNERPYRCPACPATYRRETHLTAHMRMHLPEESKPFQCNWKDTEPLEWSPKAPESLICNKRFWTKQHLRVHVQSVHEKKKSQPRFSCEKCCQTFTKHHLLKTHFAEAHCPPNTKPFQCDYEGCSLSFLTCSKLRKHQQTHEPNRYSCVHEDCLSKSLLSQLSFPTWTKLQAHNRLCHPLRCEVEGCSGGSKTYKSPKSLSNHMINHHHRSNQSSSSNIKRPDLKISYKTALKTFRCAEPKHSSSDEICGKSYQSARSLQRHIKIIHSPDNNGHRVTCPIEGCNFCSSYPSGLKKHILTHERHPETKQPSLRTSKSNEPGQRSLLTGNIYYGNEKNDEVECLEGKRSDWTETSKKRRFGCPLVEFENQDEDLLMKIFSDEEQLKRFKEVRRGTTCLFRFNRVYDLQRHLRADHSIEVDRETLKSFFSSQS
ncbi:hypothetical protein BY996DRAFT_6432007 [Phakopsora pachyrhizi]|nr:hypothetical protein BY996DRAFT_6432007 [Phakopsora pachyrhizi]